MADEFAPIGVEAIVEGFNQFMGDLRQMEVQYDKTVDRFRDANGKFVADSKVAEKALGSLIKKFFQVAQAGERAGEGAGQGGDQAKQAGGLFDFLAKRATAASGGVGTLVSAIGGPAGLVVGMGVAVAGVKVAGAIFNWFTDVVRRVASEIQKAVLTAGRFQELEFAALAIGRAMGKSEGEIRGAIESISDLGIRSDVASQTVAQFIRNNIDLAKSTELVRVAQALAVIAGEDSSQTMERLTLAISTNSVARLRGLGITTTAAEAQRKFAMENGVAADSLTELQKRQALTNSIIEDGARLLDVYDAAMQSPTKQLRSLTGRELPELSAAFGSFFTPALGTAIKTIRQFVVAITEAIQEGGFLFDLLVGIGATVSIWADAFAEIGGIVVNFVNRLNSAGKMMSDGAAKTGVEFTGNLSKAMNSGMEGIVTSMLRWGVELVAALAEGIVSAASTVLVSAMNAISNALTFWLAPGSPPRVAPDIDKWGLSAMAEYLHGFTKADFSVLEAIQAPLKKVLSGPEFAAISKDIIKSMGTGDIGEGIFSRIAKTAGQFGQEVARLARTQVALGKATDEVAAAEKRLADSRKRVSQEQATLNSQVRAFNRDLRQGIKFTEEERAARLAQIKTTETGLDIASQQATEAEKALDIAKDEEARLKERASLQQKVLDQLLAIDEAMKDVEESAGGAARAAGGMGGGIGKALEGISGIALDPAQFDIGSRIGEAIEEAKRKIKQNLFDPKEGLFAPLIKAWRNARDELGDLGEPFKEAISVIGLAVMKANGIFAGFIADFLGGIGVIVDSMIGISDSLGIPTDGLTDFRNDVLRPLWQQYTDIAAETDVALRKAQGFGENVPTEKVSAFAGAVGDGFAALEEFRSKAAASKKAVGELGDDLPTSKVLSFTENAIAPLAKGMSDVAAAAENAGKAMRDVGKEADKDFSAWDPFKSQSPAPLEKGFRGTTRAIREFSAVAVPRLASAGATVGALAPVPSPGMSGGGQPGGNVQNVRNTQFNVGPFMVGNEMDLQRTKAGIIQMIRQELQRGA